MPACHPQGNSLRNASHSLVSVTQAPVTKYHRLCSLNHRSLFLMVLEAENSEINVPAHSVPEGDSLPGMQTAVFLLCPHMMEGGKERKKGRKKKEKERASFYRGTDAITMDIPFRRTSSKPKNLQVLISYHRHTEGG